MNTYELESTDLHRITYHEINPSSSKLVICFAYQGGGLGTKGFGSALCEQNNWNYVYVGKKKQTKFRSLSIDRLFELIYPFSTGIDIVAYGASAGGYAALYFGGALDGRCCATQLAA